MQGLEKVGHYLARYDISTFMVPLRKKWNHLITDNADFGGHFLFSFRMLYIIRLAGGALNYPICKFYMLWGSLEYVLALLVAERTLEY